MERIGGLSDDDLAIIKDAESRGEGAVERSVDAAEKTMAASKSAAEKAAIAATTAASAAEKAADVAEATEENYTFPQSQAEATSEAATNEAGAVIAAEAEEAQSVMRKEVDLVPAVEAAEMAQSEVATSEVVEQQVEQSAEPVKTIVQDQADVKSVVNNWAEAWQSKDIDTYVAKYVPTFRGKLRSRQRWLKQRDTRIAKRKGDISVEIEDLDVVKNKNTGEWLIWRETTIPKSKRPVVEKVIPAQVQQPKVGNTAEEESLESQIERIGF